MDWKALIVFLSMVTMAQYVSWYQSNSLILWDWLKQHYILAIVLTAPFVGLAFAYATKIGYEVLGTLWAVRFSAFAIGYLVFIVLAWYHFDESPFSMKNIITSILCFAVLGVQILWK